MSRSTGRPSSSLTRRWPGGNPAPPAVQRPWLSQGLSLFGCSAAVCACCIASEKPRPPSQALSGSRPVPGPKNRTLPAETTCDLDRARQCGYAHVHVPKSSSLREGNHGPPLSFYCSNCRAWSCRSEQRVRARYRQDRLYPADDRPAAIHRQTGSRGHQALYGAACRHGRRQKDPAHNQGRRRHSRQHQAHRPGAHCQREGELPRRLRRDAGGALGRPSLGGIQDARDRHRGRHLDHHREIALYRAHQLHAGAIDRADGRLGRGQRHQESGDDDLRLRAGRRRRKILRRRVQEKGRRYS